MDIDPIAERIEGEVAEQSGVSVVVERQGERLVVSGFVSSEGERRAVFDIISDLAPNDIVDDNLELNQVLPEEVDGMQLSEAEAGDFPGARTGTEDDEALEPGDFMDQEILENPLNAAGPTGVAEDADIGEGEEVYVPPTDPVITREGEVLGGFDTTSMDEVELPRSSDGTIGDEALAEAIRNELREDATTQDMRLAVEVRNGVVRLRGRVTSVTDAENAEAVAGRILGVEEVLDELEVVNL
jgi:hypothetical protein